MWLEVIFFIFATVLLVLGVFLCSLIIHYFKSKNDLHKTALDTIMVDTVWSIIFLISTMYVGVILIIFSPEEKYSFGFVLGFTVTFFAVRVYFISASFVTILTKLCYIRFPGTMLETSDKTIYWCSILARLVLISLDIFLNHVKPMTNKPPAPFLHLLKNPHEYQRYLTKVLWTFC